MSSEMKKNFFKLMNDSVHGKTISYTEKYQDNIPYSFSYKLVCIDNKFSTRLFFTG